MALSREESQLLRFATTTFEDPAAVDTGTKAGGGVIAAAAGTFIQKAVAAGTHVAGAVPLAILRYAIHGIPEIIAYFVAGLAGGIISVAMINRDLESSKFRRIILDVIDLCLIAIVILILAALLEVYVTPLFFS